MKRKRGNIIRNKKIVVWFSCGVASAVAAKKTVEKYGQRNEILIVNNPVAEEHEDNQRFLKDVEKWIGLPIIHAVNTEIGTISAVDIWDKRKYMSGTKGAPCTMLLKRQARYEFETKHEIDWHVLGFTFEEKKRHNNFTKAERPNVIPVLIDAKLSKQDCFSIIKNSGIEPPKIYSFSFPNANCIGCVKATSPTYWNLVRKTFPKVFLERVEQSKEIGCRLVRVKGKRIFLDELNPNAKGGTIRSYECGIFCTIK
jgi:hypothetical protein